MKWLFGQTATSQISDRFKEYHQSDYWNTSNFDHFLDIWMEMSPASKIHAQQVWLVSGKKGEDAIVGIIDEGLVWSEHPDLKNNVDSTNSGRGEHATNCAGIICGNGLIKGITPEARLRSRSGDISQAILGLSGEGVHVINISMASSIDEAKKPENKAAFTNAMERAKEKNVLVVVSHTNDTTNLVSLAALLENGSELRNNIIVVDDILTFLHLNIKDADIYADVSNGIYTTKIPDSNDKGSLVTNGFHGSTSVATAMVTGAAALLKSIDPDLSAIDLKTILIESGSGPNKNGLPILHALKAYIYWFKNFNDSTQNLTNNRGGSNRRLRLAGLLEKTFLR
ncbi:MAG: S8 family serine peptidase [Saprospiraceae bacterium]|nr:S8 family serine peptidase [Saprospiraceae bacterium]